MGINVGSFVENLMTFINIPMNFFISFCSSFLLVIGIYIHYAVEYDATKIMKFHTEEEEFFFNFSFSCTICKLLNINKPRIQYDNVFGFLKFFCINLAVKYNKYINSEKNIYLKSDFSLSINSLDLYNKLKESYLLQIRKLNQEYTEFVQQELDFFIKILREFYIKKFDKNFDLLFDLTNLFQCSDHFSIVEDYNKNILIDCKENTDKMIIQMPMYNFSKGNLENNFNFTFSEFLKSKHDKVLVVEALFYYIQLFNNHASGKFFMYEKLIQKHNIFYDKISYFAQKAMENGKILEVCLTFDVNIKKELYSNFNTTHLSFEILTIFFLKINQIFQEMITGLKNLQADSLEERILSEKLTVQKEDVFNYIKQVAIKNKYKIVYLTKKNNSSLFSSQKKNLKIKKKKTLELNKLPLNKVTLRKEENNLKAKLPCSSLKADDNNESNITNFSDICISTEQSNAEKQKFDSLLLESDVQDALSKIKSTDGKLVNNTKDDKIIATNQKKEKTLQTKPEFTKLYSDDIKQILDDLIQNLEIDSNKNAINCTDILPQKNQNTTKLSNHNKKEKQKRIRNRRNLNKKKNGSIPLVAEITEENMNDSKMNRIDPTIETIKIDSIPKLIFSHDSISLFDNKKQNLLRANSHDKDKINNCKGKKFSSLNININPENTSQLSICKNNAINSQTNQFDAINNKKIKQKINSNHRHNIKKNKCTILMKNQTNPWQNNYNIKLETKIQLKNIKKKQEKTVKDEFCLFTDEIQYFADFFNKIPKECQSFFINDFNDTYENYNCLDKSDDIFSEYNSQERINEKLAGIFNRENKNYAIYSNSQCDCGLKWNQPLFKQKEYDSDKKE